jgi:hypothetical protein
MKGRSSLAGAALVFLWVAVAANGQFVPQPPFGDDDGLSGFRRDWTWAMNPAGDPAWTTPPGANWRVTLTSGAANPEGRKPLTITGQHMVGPHADDAVPNPNSVTIALTALGAGMQRAGIRQVAHPVAHRNYYQYSVTVPAAAPPATIAFRGWHYGARNLARFVRGSYHNGWNANVDARFRASYPDGTWGAWTDWGLVEPAYSKSTKFTKNAANLLPTDYDVEVKVRGLRTGQSYETLAFLGETDSGFEKLDLWEAADLMVGAETYLAPMVWNDAQDLYAGIDLTQWLSFGAVFPSGHAFSFENGVCSELPGYMVGTSPVMLDPAVGFVTASPYTGTAVKWGDIDGGTPEPGTILLALFGVTAASAGRRR